MMYRALTRFADLEDAMRIYEPGDEFPRPGLEVSDIRLEELCGKANKAHRPLIERTETPREAEEQPKEAKPKRKKK